MKVADIKMTALVSCAFFLFTLTGFSNGLDTHEPAPSPTTHEGMDESADNQSYALNETEKALFELWYYALQVKGIENDLRLWYMPETERRNQHVPAEESEKIEVIATELSAFDVPDALNKTHELLVTTIASLKKIAEFIPSEDDGNLEALATSYWDAYRSFRTAFYADADLHFTIPEATGDDHLLREELKLITDAEDRLALENADEALIGKKHTDTVSILEPLLGKYRNHPAEGSILVRYVDAHIAHDSPFSQAQDAYAMEKRMRVLLDDYVERMPYSVMLYRLYWQWRTLSQLENGSSNWSDINNWDYNIMWRRVTHTIMAQLGQHPDDRWAKLVLLSLQQLIGIIERFALQVGIGNTNIIELAQLNGFWAEILKAEKEPGGHTVNMPGGILIFYGENLLPAVFMLDAAEGARNNILGACRAFADRLAKQLERHDTAAFVRHVALDEQLVDVFAEQFAERQYNGLVQLSVKIRENEEYPGEYDTLLNADFLSLTPCPDEERAVLTGDKQHVVDFVIDTTSPDGKKEVIVDYLAIEFFEVLKARGYLDASNLKDLEIPDEFEGTRP